VVGVLSSMKDAVLFHFLTEILIAEAMNKHQQTHIASSTRLRWVTWLRWSGSFENIRWLKEIQTLQDSVFNATGVSLNSSLHCCLNE
jgi:hypothetical protein